MAAVSVLSMYSFLVRVPNNTAQHSIYIVVGVMNYLEMFSSDAGGCRLVICKYTLPFYRRNLSVPCIKERQPEEGLYKCNPTMAHHLHTYLFSLEYCTCLSTSQRGKKQVVCFLHCSQNLAAFCEQIFWGFISTQAIPSVEIPTMHPVINCYAFYHQVFLKWK